MPCECHLLAVVGDDPWGSDVVAQHNSYFPLLHHVEPVEAAEDSSSGKLNASLACIPSLA